MAGVPYWLNTAWMLSCAREAFAFRRAVGKVRDTQERILKRLVRDNRDTWYGRRYGFASIHSTRDYQQRVPVVGYEGLCDAIDRIAAGASGVLTREPVTLLEPTGGSSQAEKLIPYTKSLQSEFQRAIATWVYDVMSRIPAARNGRAYWSISPPAERRRLSSGGIPIGFDDDRDYLSGWQRAAVSRLMILPQAVKHLRSVENARYLTALHLLASRDLALMSVWSPTWLTCLLGDIVEWSDQICEDLRLGRVTLPEPAAEAERVLVGVGDGFPFDSHRSEELRRIFSSADATGQWTTACWPGLALVSCWGDATSALYLPDLRRQLPHPLIQPKGLLATEGAISIPLLSDGFPGCVLALRSHFFEFAEADTVGSGVRDCVLADQLQVGRRYRVILSNGGGLYRYDLGDEIEVVGFYHDCPRIRFLGRSGRTSDLVGEKLSDAFVRDVFRQVFHEQQLDVRFALLAPVSGGDRHYRAYVQCDAAAVDDSARIAQELERCLMLNPQYRLAVEAKQLGAVDVRFVGRGAWKAYERVCLRRGQTLGDIKPVALDSWEGWDEALSCGLQGGTR